MNIQQLAHEYANKNNNDSGRCGNASYRDGGFYSWATCICRRINSQKHGTFYIMSSHNHGSTFTSKHIRALRRALDGHEPIYCVDGESRGTSLHSRSSDEQVIDAIMLHNQSCVKAAMQQYIKCRTSKELKMKWLVEAMQKANKDAETFDRDATFPPEKFTQLEEATRAEIAREKKENAKLHAERRERERLAAIQHQKDLEEAQVVLNAWAAGDDERHRLFYQLPIMCRPRANKTLIETSNRAVIPYAEGRKVFDLFIKGVAYDEHVHDSALMVGDYSARKITTDEIVVGCTTILREEIERFAKQEGWA